MLLFSPFFAKAALIKFFSEKKMDAFYNGIIYQKNAIGELAKYLAKNYFKKKVLCVFSSQAKKERFSRILNCLNKAGCVYTTVTLDRVPFVSSEMISAIIATNSRSVDLVLGVGGGACSDAVKILAKKYACESLFVASTFGNMSYFNQLAIMETSDKIEFENTFSHSKVYIDEVWIKHLSANKNIQTQLFLCALNSCTEELWFHKLIYGNNPPIDIDALSKTIQEMKKEMNSDISEDEKNLRLEDYVIEISFLLKDSQLEYFYFIKMANLLSKLLHKRNTQNSFCNLCYISAKTLEQFYCEFYDIKHIQLFEPYKLQDSLHLSEKFGINHSCVKREDAKYYYHKNKLFFQKINAMKNSLGKKSQISKDEILNFSYKDTNIINFLSGQDLYDLFKMFSMVYDSGMVVGLIKRAGLLNA